MSKSFKVSPHVAYLNHEVSITNISDRILEMYDNESFVTIIQPNSVYKSKFTAGHHNITAKYDGQYFLDEKDELIVEDAIKLGGGKVIDGYIFNGSWILVKMTDRMYFHNITTNEDVVEMNLVPDTIQPLSQDLLLLSTKSEGYSIFSLNTLNIVAKFQNAPIYIGQNSLVYLNSTDTITIFYYESADSQLYKFKKYALNQLDNVLNVYSDELMFHVSLKENSSSINLFIDDPVLNIMSNGCYACLSRQNNINQIVVYRIDSSRDVRIDSININPNTISVGEIPLVLPNFKEKLKSEYDKLRTTLNNQYTNCISIDFRYSEILEVFATCTDICYTVRETFKTKYGTAEEYRLIIPKLKEDIKIAAYSRIYQQDESIFLELSSEIIILHKNVLRRVKGTLVKYNNRYYVSSILEDTKLISTIEGDVLYQGTFEFTTIAHSLVLKKNDSINVFEKFGWVVDTVEGQKSLRNVFNEWRIKAYDSLYIAKNSIIYKHDGKYYSVTSDSFGTPISIHNGDFSNLICIADSGNGTLNNIDGKITYSYHSIFDSSLKDKVILTDIFDHSAYSEALFANDGESVVYADKKGKYFLHNLITNEVVEFNSGKFIKHINGYSPLINIDSNRIPRIINPLTGRFVESRLFDYTFASPDGKWVVITPENKAKDSVGGIECLHKGTGKEIPHNEYHTYHFQLDTGSREASQHCIEQRKGFIKDYPSCFVSSIQEFLRGTRWEKIRIDAVNLRRYAYDMNSVDRCTAEAIEFYLKYYRFFTGVIFDIKEYVYIKNEADTVISKIEIGRPLWFINYISFSYDSRYVAIAGRYEDDTEDESRTSLGGLFLLYDLVENKVVTKKTNSQAVWVTSFTPRGNVGLYDSRPTTYITSTNNSEITSIAGRSFLTFSPSGKFFALSNQGYVRYDNVKYNQVAGHQPSTNVYIRHINDLQSELAHFNDHGDKITGVLTKRQKTVAMVAFSPDDKKLMSVSDDGVIVIRNLHL